MAQRIVRCGCGAEVPIPEIPPSILHCPRCGDRMFFGSADEGPVRAREDLREPLRPLPPSRPYFPLILLATAGALIAGGLVTAMAYLTRSPRSLPDAATEGVRAKRRDPEPVLAIREIPVIPSDPQSPPLVADPSKVPPLIPEPPPDVSGPLAKAQERGIRANVAGIVCTILTLTGNVEEARRTAFEIARLDAEIREILAPLGDRPEARSVDYFKPGDELLGFGAVSRDPVQPLLFAEALRSWLSEAQPGAHALATIERSGRSFIQPMWFPDLPTDLTRRALPPAPNTGK